MATSIKERMYNFEEIPPQGVWEDIVAKLDSEQGLVIPMNKKRSRLLNYGLVVAASVAVVFFAVIFFRPSKTEPPLTAKDIRKNTIEDIALQKQDETERNGLIITVPLKEKPAEKEDFAIKPASKVPLKKDIDKSENPTVRDNVPEDTDESKDSNKPAYITITGPAGQAVKVSSKVTALMESSEDPAKPVWSKKVKEWQSQMQANTLAPTPGNFMDIIELTKSLKEK